MSRNICEIADIVIQMDEQLRSDLLIKDGVIQEKKLWDNTYIKHQLDKRNSGGNFTLTDHIRAMVYSMLSSGTRWERIEKGIDIETGMYEEFIPTMGLGKRFVFTENSLIFGTKEYAYSQLSPITLVTAATFITNGVAQTKTEDGITLTLGYNHKDNERFATVLTYANKQIDIANGNAPNYKYILQSPSGSKIEVYDDYEDSGMIIGM